MNAQIFQSRMSGQGRWQNGKVWNFVWDTDYNLDFKSEAFLAVERSGGLPD